MENFFALENRSPSPLSAIRRGFSASSMAWLDKNGQTGHVAGYFSPFGDRFGRTCVWLAADPRRVHGVGRAIVSGQTSARAGRPERRLIDSCSEYRLAAIHLITGCAGRGGRASRPSPGFLCIGRKIMNAREFRSMAERGAASYSASRSGTTFENNSANGPKILRPRRKPSTRLAITAPRAGNPEPLFN